MADFTCRVCHGDGSSAENGPLMSPCLCDGSIRWVHRRCLDQWRLRGSKRADRATRCELCGFTYLYEVQWVSSIEKVESLFSRASGVTAVVSVVGLLALISSARDAALTVGWSFFIWAASDMMPWDLSEQVVKTAVSELLAVALLPAAKRRLQAQATAQAKAAGHAARAAKTLEQYRPPSHDIELAMTSASTRDESAPQPSGIDATDVASVVHEDDTEGDLGSSCLPCSNQWTAETTNMDQYRGSCQSQQIALAVWVPLLVGGLYIWNMQVLFLSPSMEGEPFFAHIVAALGLTYWLAAFLLLLLLAICSSPSCEAIRGQNGFYIVRNLQHHERTHCGDESC